MRRLTTFIAPGAAVVYFALFVGAYLLATKGPCGTGCFARTTDERVVAFYADSGNRWRVGIAYLLLGVALGTFLWFLARLHEGLLVLAKARNDPAVFDQFRGDVRRLLGLAI